MSGPYRPVGNVPPMKMPSAPPVIGSAYQPHQAEHRTAMTYSSLRPTPDRDAAQLQRALLADASRRARSMRSATSDDMRLAKAHRICFDLLRALRLRASP